MLKYTEFINTKEGKNGSSFSIFILFYFFAFLIFFIVFLALGGGEKLDSFLSFSCLLTATVVSLFVLKKDGVRQLKIFNKFNPLYLLLALLLTIGMLFGLGSINIYFADFLAKIGVNVSQVEMNLSSFQNYVKYVLLFAVAPAILEEIVFRGILTREIKGNLISISLLCALCFSLYHFSLSQFIYQFIYGFFLSVLAIKAGSIVPSIFAHFLNNFIIISTNYFNLKINLFSPWIILIGITCLVIFSLFTLDFTKQKNQSTCMEKLNVGNFLLGASIGIIICFVMMVGTAFD